MGFDLSKFKDFSIHSINWALSGISHALFLIGQLQIDQQLAEDVKNAQIDTHKSLIINLISLIIPFIDIAEDIFPQYKPLLDWIKNIDENYQSKGIIKSCVCVGCQNQQSSVEATPSE